MRLKAAFELRFAKRLCNFACRRTVFALRTGETFLRIEFSEASHV